MTWLHVIFHLLQQWWWISREAFSSGRCPWQGVGTRWSFRPLPTHSGIPWFHDLVVVLQLSTRNIPPKDGSSGSSLFICFISTGKPGFARTGDIFSQSSWADKAIFGSVLIFKLVLSQRSFRNQNLPTVNWVWKSSSPERASVNEWHNIPSLQFPIC